MLDPTPDIRPCWLSTLRPSRTEETEVRLVGAPRVGRPMILFHRGGHRIITSRVTRLMVDAANSGTYVQTRNTLYYLTETPRTSAAR